MKLFSLISIIQLCLLLNGNLYGDSGQYEKKFKDCSPKAVIELKKSFRFITSNYSKIIDNANLK